MYEIETIKRNNAPRRAEVARPVRLAMCCECGGAWPLLRGGTVARHDAEGRSSKPYCPGSGHKPHRSNVTREHALAMACDLSRELGAGWQARVTFSPIGPGWVYRAWLAGVWVCGEMNARGARLQNYSVFIGNSDEIASGRWSGSGKTPGAALRGAVEQAEADLGPSLVSVGIAMTFARSAS